MPLPHRRERRELSSDSGTTQEIVEIGLVGIPGNGPHMIVQITVAGDAITAARYSTYGCPAAQACGQWVTEAVEGKSLAEAAAITEADLIAGVGRMPLGREHCRRLAVGALRDAIGKVEAEES